MPKSIIMLTLATLGPVACDKASVDRNKKHNFYLQTQDQLPKTPVFFCLSFNGIRSQCTCTPNIVITSLKLPRKLYITFSKPRGQYRVGCT